MRRVCAFFPWQENKWTSLAAKYESSNLEGKIAYALRQADLRKRMKLHCEEKWRELEPKLVTMDGRNAWVMVECH